MYIGVVGITWFIDFQNDVSVDCQIQESGGKRKNPDRMGQFFFYRLLCDRK